MAHALAVTLVARDGESERVAEGLRILAEASGNEPGCRLFIAHRSTEDRHRFLLYELYDDEPAFLRHRDTPHFADYAETIVPLLSVREPVFYKTLE